MSSTQWQPLVARAADTPSLSQRGRLWLEAIDQTGSTAAEGPLDAFSPPEATGMVDSGGSSAAHVYRLGVLGYAIFAGGIPWKERTADELVHSILTEHLPAFSYSDWPSIFQGRINRIIARATEKDPGARFAGLRELRVAVTGALAVLDEERTETEHRPRLHREAYRHIDRWLHRARAGTVAALAVVGTSGIGKTYLWETVRDAHARPGERWLYVKAGQVAQRPYETITLLLESVRDDIAALVADDRVSPLVRAFLHAIAPHIVPAGSLEEASEVRDPAGELAHIIRYIGATADFRVVCFDDFQWIDPYSRQVIEALVHGPDQLPVVTLSRGDIPRSITSDIVYLKPLSREHAWELARAQSSTTGSVLQDTFDRAFALSAGNPMVLQSVLSAGASEVPADAEDV
ncbi:MAG TPA: ATP-binding protein, partial [Alkalispirochaeta sp.]|nr:ATP-binding protein [Alkalispirochaeta sp.]